MGHMPGSLVPFWVLSSYRLTLSTALLSQSTLANGLHRLLEFCLQAYDSKHIQKPMSVAPPSANVLTPRADFGISLSQSYAYSR